MLVDKVYWFTIISCLRVQMFCLSAWMTLFLASFSIHKTSASVDKLRFLETVDDRIIELLAKPLKRNAEYILDQIDLYNHCLYNIIEIMRLKTPDFLETVRSFMDTRGPACIQQPIDEDYLKQGFGWSEEKLYDFKLIFTQTFELWDLFLETYMKMKVHYRTYIATDDPLSDEVHL